jgi:hypothetical protein
LIEAVAVFGEAVAESAVLDSAVQLLKPPQQIKEGGRIAFETFGQGQQNPELLISRRSAGGRPGATGGRLGGDWVVEGGRRLWGHAPLIQVVESRCKLSGVGVLHR